jgi:hypothetical protein
MILLFTCYHHWGLIPRGVSINGNKIADNISYAKKMSTNPLHSFDYSTLHQTNPELIHCSFFQIHPKLISLIWEIVLTEKWPTKEEVQTLKQKPLGGLTTSNGQESWESQTHADQM